DALLRLAHELPVATSARVEALRKGLLDFARALEQVAAASSLTELGQTGGGGGLAAFANAVDQLARLVAGTRRRIDELEESESLDSGASIRVLDLCVERALRGNPDDLVEAIQATTSALERELPQAVACVAGFALERLRRLPLDAPRRTYSSFMPAPPKEAPLPAWIPVSRSLGGFHVLRSLGAGAVGSVFVARRAEERHDPTAPQFALKVPDYSGAAARTLSEEQFLHLFREEAGALLALPNHPNIATFVTFDAGVRPKPILVMELVEGPTLERVLEMADLDMERALDVLLGVAAGLAGMHSVGVGHLDVKPSNVILRDAEGSAGVEAWGNAVLVDFGLAGRHLRPGCGTAEYGCPEVWGLASGGDFRSHRVEPADVYSFGCLAYEVLTGQVLFDGDNEIEMITGHLTHDGMPAPIGRLTTDPRTAKLAEILRWTLRRDPAERANMQAVLAALSRVRPDLERLAWPLVA
ncbi:MAG: serine/threonine protein kinase, partial [Myxococcales bacterium]|nr:serine/threonine protein kinase [Myxococcales bacterium]